LAVRDKPARPAVSRDDDRFAGGPALQDHDAERFVAARHTYDIGALEQIDQVAIRPHGAEKTDGTADEIVQNLQPLILGDPKRIRPVTLVEPDAPDAGMVAIVVMSKSKSK
jgi:hypothetical protein